MPTYEYACSACEHQFEEFQSIMAKPLTKCPECKKKKVKRLISAGAGFIFKGSGFYTTDYRSESYKAAAKSDTSAPTTGEKGGKTESAAPVKSPSAATEKTESKPAGDAKTAKK